MKYHIQAVIAMVLFALSFIWSKQALSLISPVMLVTFRVAIAMVLVSTIAFVSGKMQRINRRDMLWIMLMALAEPVAYFLFETAGIKRVTPTLACLMMGLMPVIAPFFAYLLNRERVTSWTWVGLFVGFAGVAVVALSNGVDSLDGQIVGVLLLGGSVFTAIVYTLMLQRISKRVNSFTIVSWLNLFSVIFLIPILFIFDYQGVVDLTFSWDWAYPVLTLGVLCSSIAFILYANGVRELGVTRTALYINLMPAMTAVASYFIIGEPLGVVKIGGILLTIIGLFLANRAPKSGLTH